METVAHVRALVEFYVNQHNTKMLHPALAGQTPDEMFFGTGIRVPEELALAKSNAREARLVASHDFLRAMPQAASHPASTSGSLIVSRMSHLRTETVKCLRCQHGESQVRNRHRQRQVQMAGRSILWPTGALYSVPVRASSTCGDCPTDTY